MRLSTEEFWTLTPRQFHLLMDRHREQKLHLEMLLGWNTAATINAAPFAREEPATAIQFMPNHPDFAGEGKQDLTDDQEDANADYMAKVMQVAAELKAGGGAMLTRLLEGKA